MTISNDTVNSTVTQSTVWIETGSGLGNTIERALKAGASSVCSCDIDSELASSAAARFSHVQEVSIECADSPQWLLDTLPIAAAANPRHRLVVLLDAHKGACSSLLEELRAINKSKVKPDALIIDDWRYVDAGFWGVSPDDVREQLDQIYDKSWSELLVDGAGDCVDILNGPPIGDVFIAEGIL